MQKKEKAMVATLNLVLSPELIKVQTVKRSYIEQMCKLGHKEFTEATKAGRVMAVGRGYAIKDLGDVIVLQTMDGRLVRVQEITYRSYLNTAARFDLNLTDPDEIGIYVEKEINKIPQLFTT